MYTNGWPCSLQVQLLQDRWGLRTLHAIVPAWCSLTAAQAASRRRLRQTVQRVYLQQLMQAWHLRACRRVQLKIVALASWKQAVVWQQKKPLLLCTALSHYERRYGRCAKNNINGATGGCTRCHTTYVTCLCKCAGKLHGQDMTDAVQASMLSAQCSFYHCSSRLNNLSSHPEFMSRADMLQIAVRVL
jgi:hypothetical protein